MKKPYTQSKVAVVIPARNEEAYISDTIDMLRADDHFNEYCVVLVDGKSTDRTVSIAEALDIDNLHIISNEKMNQAAAVNLAAQFASKSSPPEYLVRIDAHSTYPKNYVKNIVATARRTGADSVVVPMQTKGGNRTQNAAQILFNSWLGNGGAAHRGRGSSGWVEHGHHALFRFRAFTEVGGYDEEFLANEDAELDFRLAKAGYKIYLDGSSSIGYIPRPTLAKTFLQMRRNGFYRMKNLLKHRQLPRLRQTLPILVAPYLVLVGILTFLVSPLFFGLGLLYFGPVAALSIRASKNSGMRSVGTSFLTFLLAFVSHAGFSVGAIEGLFSGILQRSGKRVPS